MLIRAIFDYFSKKIALITVPYCLLPRNLVLGTEEIVSHCIVNKQMASVSSYMICPLCDCDLSIKLPSIILIGSMSVDMGATYVNK